MHLRKLRGRRESQGIETVDASGNVTYVCLPSVDYLKVKTGGNDPTIARTAKYGNLVRYTKSGTVLHASDVGFVLPPIVPLTNKY